MNSEEIQQIWAEVCSRVKGYEGIVPSQIDAFFSMLHPQAASDGFIMLTANTDFIKTWIERNYIDYIKRALEELRGVPFTVIIEVDPTQTAAPAAPAAPTAAPAPLTAPAPQSAPARAVATPPTPSADAVPTPAPVSQASRQSDATPSPAAPMPAAAASTPEQPKETSEQTQEQPAAEEHTEAPESDNSTPLSTLTFENFVIGDSNRLAYSMATAVAEAPGKPHLNPLFIYGKSGLGKTHLLRAIQNYINRNMPQLQVVYKDSAELLDDYTEASAAHDTEKSSYKNFKTSYEDADVLLVDDVQYLQGKKQTLDIMFQIFNKLTSQGRQVVLSADRAPKNIDIDERYKTRFNSGGTFDIQPPEIETKLGIVKSFIREYQEQEGSMAFTMPTDIQTYIAESSSSNIRELKSAVTKVIFQMTYGNQPNMTLADVRALLENHFSGGPSKRLNAEDIQKAVEGFYKVSHAEIVGKRRSRSITNARQIAMYLCRQLLDMPYESIGKKFNRDHSTALYSVTMIETKLKENRLLREEIEALQQIIREA